MFTISVHENVAANQTDSNNKQSKGVPAAEYQVQWSACHSQRTAAAISAAPAPSGL